MNDQDWLAERFEADRAHLRGVAYRMLGSLTEADDAVQEAWIRLSRTDTSEVENLRAWLTTVVGRVCLNMLRSRKTRREASLETHLPDPIVSPEAGLDPEQEALLGDSVGLAMLVVLDALTPAERVAFVLHDVFAVPFDEIAPDRRPHADGGAAAREPRASPRPGRARARRRPRWPMGRRRRLPRGGARRRLRTPPRRPRPRRRPALRRRRRRVRAWSSLVRGARGRRRAGDDLPPVRRDGDAGPRRTGSRAASPGRPTGSPFAVLALTVRGGRIVAIDVLADPDRLAPAGPHGGRRLRVRLSDRGHVRALLAGHLCDTADRPRRSDPR